MKDVKIDKKTWDRMKTKLQRAERAHVKIGILASQGGAAKHGGNKSLTVVDIGAINEFGSRAAGVPERSFIRSTFAANKTLFAKWCAKGAREFVTGRATLSRALDEIGHKAATEVKKTITQGAGVPPPNAPSTIAAKGSARPLVADGQLLNSITHRVEGA